MLTIIITILLVDEFSHHVGSYGPLWAHIGPNMGSAPRSQPPTLSSRKSLETKLDTHINTYIFPFQTKRKLISNICIFLKLQKEIVSEHWKQKTNSSHELDPGHLPVVVHMMPRVLMHAAGGWVQPTSGDFPRGISPAWGSVRRAGVHRADFRVAT